MDTPYWVSLTDAGETALHFERYYVAKKGKEEMRLFLLTDNPDLHILLHLAGPVRGLVKLRSDLPINQHATLLPYWGNDYERAMKKAMALGFLARDDDPL